MAYFSLKKEAAPGVDVAALGGRTDPLHRLADILSEDLLQLCHQRRFE
jgi:hypothetical protein